MNTLFLSAHLTIRYREDKSLKRNIGPVRLILPYADYDDKPDPGTIVFAGISNNLFSDMVLWSPDLVNETYFSTPHASELDGDGPFFITDPDENFTNYFPNYVDASAMDDSATTDTYDWVFTFDENDYVIVKHRGSGIWMYSSLSSYLNGDPYIHSGGSIGTYVPNGSLADLGQTILVLYNEVDEQGYPKEFFTIDFYGAHSNIDRVRIHEYRRVYGDGITLMRLLWSTARNIEILDDPYAEGGTSGEGGAGGNLDGTSDAISIPSLPTLSAVDTGFIALYNPSLTQLNNLASYMWSTGFDLDTFKKLFADPMDAILGLSIVPVEVPNGGGTTVKIGNISTGVAMTKAASQYVEVDCGSINVREYWGSYLDYSPYTKAEIYLPYCGTHPISIDDIMGKTVHVVYHVDILSGACCAYVQCGESVLYTFIGQCSSSIPITGNDWTNVINGVISAAVSIGTMVGTGGAAAPMAIPALASTAVNHMKPDIEKSGAMGGTGGMLAIQTPYLIVTRPRLAVPEYQNKYMGYPSFITRFLGNITGYTEVEKIHLENIPCTGEELSEIEMLLKSGVIF